MGGNSFKLKFQKFTVPRVVVSILITALLLAILLGTVNSIFLVLMPFCVSSQAPPSSFTPGIFTEIRKGWNPVSLPAFP